MLSKRAAPPQFNSHFILKCYQVHFIQSAWGRKTVCTILTLKKKKYSSTLACQERGYIIISFCQLYSIFAVNLVSANCI